MRVRERVRVWSGRLVAVGAAVTAAVVATGGAAHGGAPDPDVVLTGDFHVGGTVTATAEHGCDAIDATLQILRPLSETVSTAVVSAQGQFVAGQPVELQAVIPATDLGGTALTPGTVLVAKLDGICDAFGDQFAAQLGEVDFVLGEAPGTPSTPLPAPTTSTPAPAAPAGSPDTGAVPATPATPAASGAQASLPRTGATGAGAAIGAALLGSGVLLARSGRRARSR